MKTLNFILKVDENKPPILFLSEGYSFSDGLLFHFQLKVSTLARFYVKNLSFKYYAMSGFILLTEALNVLKE